MKLSNLTAKLTCIKHNATRILAAATLAGAVFAAAPAAQAQRVFVGVHDGPRFVARRGFVAPPVVVYNTPDYYAPAYVAPVPEPAVTFGFYGHRDWNNRSFDHHVDRFGRR